MLMPMYRSLFTFNDLCMFRYEAAVLATEKTEFSVVRFLCKNPLNNLRAYIQFVASNSTNLPPCIA